MRFYLQPVLGAPDTFNFDQLIIPKTTPAHSPLSSNTAASSKVALSPTVGFSGSGSVWSTRRVVLADFFTWAQWITQAVGESDGILNLSGLPADFKTFPVERLEVDVIVAEFESRVFELNAALHHPDSSTLDRFRQVILNRARLSDDFLLLSLSS